jgi:transcriptional antiterminator NusG
MEAYWYIVKVLPGKERQLNESFNQEISSGKINNIKRFVCPTEKEYVVVRNKKALREKVLYSGYLYFESENKLTDDQLKWISNIPNIMGMGGNKTPILMRSDDVSRIIKDEVLEGRNESKTQKFTKGEEIIVIDGPFKTFEGIISEINEDKVDIEIKIFGRVTPFSLSLSEIKKK